MLTAEQIQSILRAIGTTDAEEITMEANPGDLTPEYLTAIHKVGVNRLSIGVQSFQDELLQLLGRRHNSKLAFEAVQMAQQAGFDNISIDLMYALPRQTIETWKADIASALSLNVQHISCYGLRYEDGTPLTQKRDNGEILPIDEDTENQMYDLLCQRLKEEGFVHYEVSNFAQSGYEAKHNSNYWNGTPYIGIGAGAHSYIQNTRSWNPENLEAYITGIMAHDLQREKEELTEIDRFNEYVMLGLRTNRGINLEKCRMNETLSRHYREHPETFQ